MDFWIEKEKFASCLAKGCAICYTEQQRMKHFRDEMRSSGDSLAKQEI